MTLYNKPAAQKNLNTGAFTLSSDPDTAMQEMMDKITALREIYLRETNALIAADTKAFLSMQEEKLDAARVYQISANEIMSRKDTFKNARSDLKTRLDRMQKEFSGIAEDNMNALGRMQRCVERLGNTIRNAARDAARKQRACSYGETGQFQDDTRKAVSMGISETA